MICKSNLERVHFLLDIHLSTSTQAGADSGGGGGGGRGGHGGAHAPPPLGLSQRKMRRFTAQLAHVATLTQRTSLCFMSCIHRALKCEAPKLKRQFRGSASNTKAVFEGKGFG